MIDLRNTIVPKSDQLNSDDLIGTTKTIRVSKVALCADEQQPIAIHYDGDQGKPYKPCKSMRRLLVSLWGPDGAAFVGRAMTLYRDESVKYGGAEVGGIRISHVSDIAKPVTIALTVTKSVRKPFRVLPLIAEVSGQTLADVLDAINESSSIEELNVAGGMAGKLTAKPEKDAARTAYVARKADLTAPPVTEPEPESATA